MGKNIKGVLNIDIVTYALSKKYTDKTIQGLGALKGANCTVKSIIENDDDTTVTFEWTGTGGTKETNVMTVPKGEDGVSVLNAHIDENQNLIVELSDGTEKNAGQLPVMKNSVDTELSDTSENPIANKAVSAELDNTVKLRKNFQAIAKEDDGSGGRPMHTITINTNTDKGDMSLSPEGITIRKNSASDTAPAAVISGESGITLYDTPVTFGQYRSSDKMKIQNNYIESDDTVNISTISSSPSLTSRIRFNTQKGSLAMSDVKSTYESSASATGQNSIAIGSTSKATGDNSIAVGKKSISSGNNSIAVGNSNYMGFWTKGTKASGNLSVALGDGVQAGYDKQVTIGSFNDNKSYNAFEIGNGGWQYPSGNYSENFSNAFSVDKTGNTLSKRNCISNGQIILQSPLLISKDISVGSVETAIAKNLYNILSYLKTELHRDDASLIRDIITGVDEFTFRVSDSYAYYMIQAKRTYLYKRGPENFNFEFSWHDALGKEQRCVISVSGTDALTDPVAHVFERRTYQVGTMEGATENNDGQSGLVPTPLKGQASYVFTGNGQWMPNILQLIKKETVAANSSVTITINDINFYLLSVIASGVPELDLYMISSYQNGGRLDCIRLTGSGDNVNYTVTRTGAEVLTITNKIAAASLECKLYRINLPNIW